LTYRFQLPDLGIDMGPLLEPDDNVDGYDLLGTLEPPLKLQPQRLSLSREHKELYLETELFPRLRFEPFVIVLKPLPDPEPVELGDPEPAYEILLEQMDLMTCEMLKG
jgi:hypothetical protein